MSVPPSRARVAKRRRPLVLSIVGARPQFIKLAPLHAALTAVARHVIVHTGQHYDNTMSSQFFRELQLPEPDLNLGIRGGGHAVPTGRMLIGIARAIETFQPQHLLIYGDTTSTLAGALAGAQSGVPVAHVESGLRSYLPTQPEERNRVVADHLSRLLFCPTLTAVENLKKEGITRGVYLVGDPLAEAMTWHWQRARKRPLKIEAPQFLFCTVHRAENTDEPVRLRKFVNLLAALKEPILFPVHPRTRKALKTAKLWPALARLPHVNLTEPFGYLDTLRHIEAARAVLTDSGGVQREAAWLGTFCLTLRPVTEWVETLTLGQNALVDLDVRKVNAALQTSHRKFPRRLRGGKVSAKIVRRLLQKR